MIASDKATVTNEECRVAFHSSVIYKAVTADKASKCETDRVHAAKGPPTISPDKLWIGTLKADENVTQKHLDTFHPGISTSSISVLDLRSRT